MTFGQMPTGPITWQRNPERARSYSPVLTVLTFLTVFTAFLVSGYVIDALGIPYGLPGGNPLTKIHPMTYCAVITFLVAAISRGNPLNYVLECTAKFPGTVYFLVLLVLMILWTLLIQHQPLTSLIDTFLPGTLLIFLISDLAPRQHQILTNFIHLSMNANAVLGIAEVVTGWRLTPISQQGVTVEWDWRGSALFGHPLENAMLSGAYILMLTFGADRSISAPVRVGCIALQMVGMVAFGGRIAMVLSFAMVGVRLFLKLGVLLRGLRFDPRVAAGIIMVVPLLVVTITLAYNLGVFDRMLERFTNDGGSAETRVAILRIFNSFPLSDLLMGPDPDVLLDKTISEGTIAGIESFVFGFFLQSGMLISLIFFCGLAAISYDLWRIGSRTGIISLVFFYIVAAGAASLSVKGQSFAQFAILYLTIEAMPSVFDRDA